MKNSNTASKCPRRIISAALAAVLAAVTLLCTSCTGTGNVMDPDMNTENGTVTEGTPSHDTNPETVIK